jgi:hypothetical protein
MLPKFDTFDMRKTQTGRRRRKNLRFFDASNGVLQKIGRSLPVKKTVKKHKEMSKIRSCLAKTGSFPSLGGSKTCRMSKKARADLISRPGKRKTPLQKRRQARRSLFIFGAGRRVVWPW